MNDITATQKIAVLYENQKEAELIHLNLKSKNNNITLINIVNLTDKTTSAYDVVIALLENAEKSLQGILLMLNPNGYLISKAKDINSTEFQLKTNGFINVTINSDKEIIGFKPSYEIGSSAKLNLKKPAAVWVLDDDDDTIDPDNLLDENDLMKPNQASLKVCGTTGKRKACKDCSCGLADELAMEGNGGTVINTSNAPKSSCGSCYLGDAFRCAECPYLGMPAFKAGEKVQLSANLLKDDF